MKKVNKSALWTWFPNMLSSKWSCTFGSIVRSVGRVWCLEKLRKSEAFCEVSLEWNRYFGYWKKSYQILWRSPPREGSRILRYWFVARPAFYEVPPEWVWDFFRYWLVARPGWISARIWGFGKSWRGYFWTLTLTLTPEDLWTPFWITLEGEI